MVYTDLSTIDFSNYKRVFTIGCSFTKYRYATWADIIAKESGTEFYNLGRPAAGNQYIFVTLNQAIKHYKIDSRDLVMIMWSSVCREDRMRGGEWRLSGNMFTSDLYSEEVKNSLMDVDWFTLRDLAIIDSTMTLLDNSSFDSVAALSVGFDDIENLNGGDAPSNPATKLYNDIEERMLPVDLFTHMGKTWPGAYSYSGCWEDGVIDTDYHPSTIDYCAWLEANGAVLSDSTIQYAYDSHEMMESVLDASELRDPIWPWRENDLITLIGERFILYG